MQKVFYLLLIIGCLSPIHTTAQSISADLWQDTSFDQIERQSDRRIIPDRFRSIALDFTQLKNLITTAPNEADQSVKNSTFTIEIPTPDGNFSTFRIIEYSMMEAKLAARYPQIRTFYGYNTNAAAESIRIDITDRGFHATYSSPEGKVYIDPYAFDDTKNYMVYYKTDYQEPYAKWACTTESLPTDTEIHTTDRLMKAGDCTFRTYRLALATTLEYSRFHGATSSAQSNLVMSAVVTTMNRVNGIFERDFAIRMILVNNTDQIFFYETPGDNYTNEDGGAMLSQNQTVCDNIIGSANYDVGHVFSTGGGGVAYLDSPCNNNLKAGGVTGQGSPTGDPFDVDYVAHEMGHQFGANHTQNNSCQRNGGTAMEPGSASTIMGYAGICNPNVQNNSDDHFHAISVSEIMDNVVSGASSGCDTEINIANNAPTVSAGANYTIPSATPFVLTATGNDSDAGDQLTYCWEQYDNEIVTHPPQSTYTSGPAFRSNSPTTSPDRYFPNLNAVITNTNPTWEVLSTVSRNYDFRVTVRDNSTNQAGCTAEDDMRVNVTDAAGPFLVTLPNVGDEVWTETATETVTWDVANTDQTPVSATTVDIFLSYDGGLTYPATLATNVPNNGSAQVTVPNGTSNTARVMVKGNNNIFFDISNEDFVIQVGSPNYTLTTNAATQSVCQDQSAIYTITVGQVLGYTDPVTLALNNVPTSATSNISPNPTTPGNDVTITVNNLNGVAAGDYSLELAGSASAGNKTLGLTLQVQAPVAAPNLTSPAANETGVSTLPSFNWAAVNSATEYDIQLASNVAFSNIVTSATVSTNSWTSDVGLDTETTYYWRVRAKNTGCGAGNYSASREFTTAACGFFTSDETVDISASGRPTITSTIAAPAGTVAEVTIPNITGTHTWTEDLIINLISPAGTSVTLVNRLCGDDNDFNIGFSDAAPNTYGEISCNPVGGGLVYQPNQSLSAFNGESSEGDWTLQIRDRADQDGGQLESWNLSICGVSSNDALAVDWLGVSTTVIQNTVQVEWEVANEVAVQQYIVERKTDGISDFIPIGAVTAIVNKNTDAVTRYDFTDKSVTAGQRYYYRIRQVEDSGNTTLSPVRTAMLERDFANQLHAFPNPVQGVMNIELTTNQSGIVQLQLFDSQGKLVRQTQTETRQLQWNVSNLPAGLYYLKTTGAVEAATKIAIR